MTATTLERISKASRLLIDGRLLITLCDSRIITASCRGDSGEVYALGYRDGHWDCSCPARTACAHLSALWLVTVKPRG